MSTKAMGQRAAALSRDDLLLGLATALSAVMMLAALYTVFIYTPMERTMGLVQKVFYFHVPSAWAGFLAFFVTFVASIVYLSRRNERADQIAVASGEVGLMFLTMAIISGSIWARPVWNTWWTWDPRLTTTTVCWLAYIAYFMLRGAMDDPERARRLAAVYGIVAFATVPMVYLSIYLLRTIHPNLFGGQAPGQIDVGLSAPEMRVALFVSLAAFTVLYGTLLWHRLRLEQLYRRITALQARLAGG